MSETAVHAPAASARPVLPRRGVPDLLSIAWRNILRTRRRTWLTASAIAFAIFLLIFMIALQVGGFMGAVDNGARMMLGHIQLQHPAYEDDPALENTVRGIDAIIKEVEAVDGVEVVSARAMSFALTSSGERSYGAQIFGVQYAKEKLWSTLPTMQLEGRYLEGPGEALIGSALARNLGIGVGDELVILGTAAEGGVAALATTVVGTYTTGQSELDRALVQVPLDDFQVAWNMAPDEAHAIVIIAESVRASERIAPTLARADLRSLDWRAMQPQVVQMLDMKLISAYVLFVLIAIIVVFSIVNSFMMVIFERTPEFGMLMAVGMRPGHIVLQLQIEALLVCMLGVVLGLGLSAVLLLILGEVGVPLPPQADEIMKVLAMPTRMYPEFDPNSLWAVPVMLVGTQVAALIPGLRLFGMQPVEALRAAE